MTLRSAYVRFNHAALLYKYADYQSLSVLIALSRGYRFDLVTIRIEWVSEATAYGAARRTDTEETDGDRVRTDSVNLIAQLIHTIGLDEVFLPLYLFTLASFPDVERVAIDCAWLKKREDLDGETKIEAYCALPVDGHIQLSSIRHQDSGP
jgi:hypothetical protein